MNKKSYYIKKDWHQSPDIKHRLGVSGEDLTAQYIETEFGMKIIDRNVRYSPGEIDIVALDRNRICFIEVKTRSSLKYGRPSLSVTADKQRTIRMLAQIYLKVHRQFAKYVPRLDVSEVIVKDGKSYINYIKSAF